MIVAAGGEADEEKLTALIADLEGKSINELLAAGQEKLKSCAGAGGGGGGGGGKLISIRPSLRRIYFSSTL